jgi:DNA-3-methyladenine glycosylase II
MITTATGTTASARRALEVRGAFDLRQSVEFGFGQRHATRYDGVMRLAMCLDGYTAQAAVAVRPEGDELRLEVVGDDPDVAARQVARVLSVDVDARDYDALGSRDPLVGRLQAARPGLRPPLFHSAYEAATWSVLATRRPLRQAAALRERLSRRHGRVLALAGEEMAAFPTPDQLLAVTSFEGLPEVALARLHAIAEEARSGRVDTAELLALDPSDALQRLRRLPGIGPFYSELILVRALGHTDVLPTGEPMVREVAAKLLGRESLDAEELERLGETWSPWRTWVAVAIRAAGPQLS